MKNVNEFSHRIEKRRNDTMKSNSTRKCRAPFFSKKMIVRKHKMSCICMFHRLKQKKNVLTLRNYKKYVKLKVHEEGKRGKI